MRTFVLVLMLVPLFASVSTFQEVERRIVRSAVEGTPGKYPSATNMAVPAGEMNKWGTSSLTGWTSGFFAGALWELYNKTSNNTVKELAMNWTAGLRKDQDDTHTHDVGFMVFDSFGKGIELGLVDEYTPVVLKTAASLATRFNPNVGCTQSWGAGHHCSCEKDVMTYFPVIIDNMMNLELLLWASEHEPDSTKAAHYKNIALSHARTTSEHHVRPDGSTFHVVDYDNKTGAVLHRCTAQGYRDNSTWSRWAPSVQLLI
jgi:hypothetical protein